MEFTIQTNEGEYDLSAGVRLIGDDILVAIWGGEKPHIGAVAAAQPRPSLKDPDEISATASVICFPGHKEDTLAKTAAETLAASFNMHAVVTAGIHWDNLSQEGIEQIKKNSEALLNSVVKKLRSDLLREI
jgi:hypothetical protein